MDGGDCSLIFVWIELLDPVKIPGSTFLLLVLLVLGRRVLLRLIDIIPDILVPLE